jgi:hypothetical protein
LDKKNSLAYPTGLGQSHMDTLTELYNLTIHNLKLNSTADLDTAQIEKMTKNKTFYLNLK